MTAYIVFIRNSLNDSEGLEVYRGLAKASYAGHEYTPLAIYGDVEVLEGPSADRVVLLSFPTVEAAKAWYFSPAYQEAKAQRLKCADYRAILFEGGEASLIANGRL